MFKKLSAILMCLLLVSSLFTGYFTLQLIDNVVVEHKLNFHEINLSEHVVAVLNLPSRTLLKQVDPEVVINLGYASPFLVSHNAQQFKVVTNTFEVKNETSKLKFVPLSNSEQKAITNIVESLFQQFVPQNQSESLIPPVTKLVAEKKPYLELPYNVKLSVPVPPPLR